MALPPPGHYLPRLTRWGVLPLWQCCGAARSALPAVQHLAQAHGITGSRAWLALEQQRQATAALHELRLRIETGPQGPAPDPDPGPRPEQ